MHNSAAAVWKGGGAANAAAKEQNPDALVAKTIAHAEVAYVAAIAAQATNPGAIDAPNKDVKQEVPFGAPSSCTHGSDTSDERSQTTFAGTCFGTPGGSLECRGAAADDVNPAARLACRQSHRRSADNPHLRSSSGESAIISKQHLSRSLASSNAPSGGGSLVANVTPTPTYAPASGIHKALE